MITRTKALGATLVAIALVILPTASAAWAEDDPNLGQTIDPAQPIVTGPKVLASGHVDMGPRFENGEWTFLIHDDAAKADADAQSTWRHPDETVFHVLDAASVVVPDDPNYAFIGVDPGSPAFVVPQTQNPDVVWLGWNTQDPEVMAAIDRGVTLSLDGVEGPGDVTVFLQSGSFGQPQVLWDSRTAGSQSIWVDVNTHTHANWAFTAPGVYLLRLTASADLIDGSTVSDTQILRMAVGSDTATDAAFAATWQGSDELGAAQADAGDATVDDDALVRGLMIAIVVVAALIAVGTVVAVRDVRVRRRALTARSESDAS